MESRSNTNGQRGLELEDQGWHDKDRGPYHLSWHSFSRKPSHEENFEDMIIWLHIEIEAECNNVQRFISITTVSRLLNLSGPRLINVVVIAFYVTPLSIGCQQRPHSSYREIQSDIFHHLSICQYFMLPRDKSGDGITTWPSQWYEISSCLNPCGVAAL